MRIEPWLVVVAMFVAASVPLFLLPINFDVSWLFYMAGRALAGVGLYEGVVEPNPPLIVWLNVPIQWASGVFGIPGPVLVKFVALLLVAASIGAAYRTLTLAEEASVPPTWFAAVLAFALLSVVDHHVFQREHIFLALAVPYVCLAAVRMQGDEIPAGWAIAIGLLGAVAFWLKPFYLPIWAAVEVVVAIRRGWRGALRPESLAVAAFGAFYLVAILLWAPAYLRVARWGATIYRPYGSEGGWVRILADPRALAAYLLLAFTIARWRRYPASPLRATLIALLIGYVVAVALQGKSFPNHWYPAEATLVLVGFVTLADVWRVRASTPSAGVRRKLAYAGGIALVALGAANAVATLSHWRSAYRSDPFYLDGMRAVLEEEGGASEFFTIGATMRSSFPLAVVTGVPYVSRFHSMWLLAGSYPGDCRTPCRPFPYHSIDDMSAAERYQFDAVIADLSRTRPEVVFVDLAPPQGMAGFDFLEYLAQSPDFRASFATYQLETTVGGRYRAYRRAG